MWQQIFNDMDECYRYELFECLNDAEKIKLISSDEMADLWADKKEGMIWLNTP